MKQIQEEASRAERRIARTAVAVTLLAAAALGALGRFREALALTLGGAVAIVSAVWISDVAGRVLVPQPLPAASGDRKFVFRALLRYLVVGLAVFLAVKVVPRELPWLAGGLSVVVAAIVIQGIREAARRTGRGGKLRGRAGEREDRG